MAQKCDFVELGAHTFGGGGLFFFEEPQGARTRYRLGSISGVKLRKDVADVALGGVQRNHQIVRDILVRRTLRQPQEHFHFAVS